ncbi:MAG: nucleotidyltransferase domain-containing protein [Candidatus Heimdallarchaeota archaeon]
MGKNELINGFIARIKSLYKGKHISVILYGSFARGDDIPESDIDFLVVLPEFNNFWNEFKKISEITNELSLKYGRVISAIPIREIDYTTGIDPLIRNVRKEGVVCGTT